MPSDSFITSSYQCRIIIRDVTGKSCWDSTILFGLKQPDHGGEGEPIDVHTKVNHIKALPLDLFNYSHRHSGL